MKRLNDAMEAFMNYGQTVGGTLPESFQEEENRWWQEGPHEGLNF